MTMTRDGGKKKPLVIGLTGGIGSGKTTVAALFGDLGVPGVDADEIARDATRPGQAGYEGIVNLFGPAATTADGGLHRRRLREIVFADAAMREKLEALIHPLVRDEIRRFIAQVNYPYCLVTIPLLLETGATENIDRVLVVDAPEQTQIARARARDQATEESIAQIMQAQLTRERRLARADEVIDNSGDLDALRRQVAELHSKYLRLAT